MNKRPTAAVILAAGLGKRMRSNLPKVLHPICGEPLLSHVLRAVEKIGAQRVYCITGHMGELVQAHVGRRAICVDQPERLGTGHAVLQAEPHLADFDGYVIVTCGDAPLLKTETFQRLIDQSKRRQTAGVVLTAIVDNPKGYGRVVRDGGEGVLKIVEEKDCTPEERAIREVNTGTYCFDSKALFSALKRVTNSNAQGEYYLTDVVEILLGDGKAFDAVVTDDWTEMIGINSRHELALAGHYLNERFLRKVMDDGITVIDPATTFLESGVTVGHDTVLEPFTVLRGTTAIGERCHIGPNAELINATIGNGATVRHSVVEGATVAKEETVGPFEYRKSTPIQATEAP